MAFGKGRGEYADDAGENILPIAQNSGGDIWGIDLTDGHVVLCCHDEEKPICYADNLKNAIFKAIFGDEYKKAINYIMKNQTNKQDFCFHDKTIYEFDDFFIRHLYKRTLWCYHAFQWIFSCEDWYDVSTDT